MSRALSLSLVVLGVLWSFEGAAHATAHPRTTASGAQQRWGAASVEVTLDPSLSQLGEGALDAVRGAFGAWVEGDASLPKLSFVVGKAKGDVARDGINRVLVTRNPMAGHEQDVAYTTSWADVQTGAILEADVVFNLAAHAFAELEDESAQSAACARAQKYDVRAVATHEVGHFFGLGEDMDDTTTTMWLRTEPCDLHKRVLHAPDLAAISGLYTTSAAGPTAGAGGCAASPVGAGGPAPAAAVVAALALSRARRRRRA